MYNIKLKKFTLSLNEISQKTKTRFSLLNKKREQVIPFCLCRDYLHDIIRWELRKEKEKIYGMEYDGTQGKNGVCLTELLLLVENITPAHALDALVLINLFEKKFKIKQSTVETHVSLNKSGVQEIHFLYSGHKKWLYHPIGLSLYSFLIRLVASGFKVPTSLEDFEQASTEYIKISEDCNIKDYLQNCYNKINDFMKIISSSKSFHPIYLQDIDNKHMFHDNSGIVSASNKGVDKVVDGRYILEDC